MAFWNRQKAAAPDGRGGQFPAPGDGAAKVKQRTVVIANPESGEGGPVFQVGASAVVVGCGVVTTAALASTAVVATVNEADTLSTVALSLAVTAFLVQIVVYVAQAGAAEAQRIHAEQLNAQTSTLLAEVKATATSTQQLVQEQFRELLRAFLDGAARTAEEAKILDPERLEQRLLQNVRSQILPEAERAAAADRPRETREPSSAARRRAVARRAQQQQQQQQLVTDPRVEILRTMPDEESGRQLLERLRKLPAAAQARLGKLAQDLIQSAETDVYEGLAFRPYSDQHLLADALATRRRTRDSDGELLDLATLSDEGVEIARLLTAEGELPPWLDLTGVATDDEIPF